MGVDPAVQGFESLPALTMTYVGPLGGIVEVLAVDYGVSLVVPVDLLESGISVVWAERAGDEALGALAAQLGVEFVRRGPHEAEFAKPRKTDVEVGVFGAGFDEPEALQRVLRSISSEVGEAEVVGGRVAFSDVPSRLRRAHGVWEDLTAPRGQWLIEARVVEVSSSWSESLGIDARLRGTAAFRVTLDDGSLTVEGQALASLLAAAEGGTEDVAMVAASRVFCVDGSSARSEFAQNVPVPRRVVSDQGTVTTQGFDIVQAGVLLDVAVRELPDGSAVLRLVPELSGIIGYVEEAPIVARSKVETEAVVRSGDVLLVGGLEQSDARIATAGLPWDLGPLVRRTDSSEGARKIYIVVRAERVSASPAVADVEPVE